MFSLSFAAARPSLSSVYHNLPAGARGKPPSAHSTARPGNHVLIRATLPRESLSPFTRHRTVRGAARYPSHAYLSLRAAHRFSSVFHAPHTASPFRGGAAPLANTYFRLRATQYFPFVFHAPHAEPPFRSSRSAVPRGASHGVFACAVGLSHATFFVRAAMHRKSKAEPEKSGSARS